MKKTTLVKSLCLAFLLFSYSGFSQVTWEKLFSKKSTDVFRCVIEVPAGGYMIAGYTADSTANDSDAYAVRMTTAGDTLWKKRINGSGSRKDLFYKVINTADGGFAFCGYSTNNGAGNDDVYFLKMDGSGVIQWSNYWGGPAKDRGQDIIQTADGGYAITGYSTSPPASYYDAFILRINSAGDTLWSKFYGGGGFEDANSIVLLPDDGFIIGGQGTNGSNGLDLYLVRANSIGDTLWTRKFGTTATDNIENILRLADGSFILAGGTDGPGLGGNDGLLVKTDSGGAAIWSKIYGGNSQDDFHQAFETTDNGFILSGTSRSSGALEPNMWLVKTDSSGDSVWTKTYGGDNHDHGYGAVQTLDGGYIFVGYSSSFGFDAEDAYVVKTNSLGEVSNYLTYITVTDLTRPLPPVCASNNVQVRVVVRNFGRDTVPAVPVSIQITGPITQTINETYNGNVYPGDLDTLAFSTLIDMSTPGQYTFTCTSAVFNNVCPQKNVYTETITVYASPTLSLGPDTISIPTGQTATLDAGPGFSSYLWSTGASSQTVTISSTSSVFVTATDANGCKASDTVFVNVLVGIDDINSEVKVEVFPNPSTGKFEISLDKANTVLSLRVFDLLGKEVFSDFTTKESAHRHSLDLSSATKGSYFLRLQFQDGFVTKRLFFQ
ncbi:MAG: T9SS type A sorting domain-containing protein [Bacteroidetes bacterium]|nr:MAG: T9SS type A sorting domain-containing protein [Bacteroidota bacterium]